VVKMVELGKYDTHLLEDYTEEEFKQMDGFIDHWRDMNFSYAAVKQLEGKYLVQNRVTGEIYESAQFLYILVAACLFSNYPRETRLEYVKRFYDAVSTFKISLPTPIMSGVRTPTRQFSSCVLIECGDSLDSINATSSAIVKYVSQRAGIGINAGRIRALGSPIRGGEAFHTGCIPFYKHFQTAVKSCSQGGVRGGAATLFYPMWHLEVESLLVLKNNRGVEGNRVRHMDYGVIGQLFRQPFALLAHQLLLAPAAHRQSLRGGTLLMTPLKGVDSQVYALAQGNILVGGAGASAGGSSVQVNQLNGGRITNGAIIERELPSQFGTGNTINLQLNNEDFTMAQQIADTINRSRGYGSATALDARTVQIRTSSGSSNQVRMLADIQNMEINVPLQDAKVIINSRTGSVVMNREVTLDSCAVAQGNLSVTVNRSANVSQPDTPFGGGQTVVTPQTQIDLRQSGGSLQSVRSSANLNNVVRALNALGATPMELMSILQSMQTAGCLRAKVEII
jgi:flagellar basal body P-ring protein FlgI